MKIFYGFKGLPKLKKPVVTIGIFDGVHLGHKKLLGRLVRKARHAGKRSVLITFKPHPFRVTHPEKTPPMLMSFDHRLRLLKKEAVDIAVVVPFTKKIARMPAKEFVKDILMKRLDTGELFIGDNFRFGKGREAAAGTIKGIAEKEKFKASIIKCRKVNGLLVSSTLIRNLILSGRLKSAARRLGRRVSILGTVVHGDKRGRVIGFPTANMDLHHEAAPPAGVYAVKALYRGKELDGILNIGFRPTFKKKKERTVEVHIFDFKKRLYGEDLEVVFIKKIRAERHFHNKAHLRRRIERDCASARRLLTP